MIILIVALASGNPKGKVPYASISDSEVCGFPEDLKFGPPSSFSSQALQKILNKADEISKLIYIATITL